MGPAVNQVFGGQNSAFGKPESSIKGDADLNACKALSPYLINADEGMGRAHVPRRPGDK